MSFELHEAGAPLAATCAAHFFVICVLCTALAIPTSDKSSLLRSDNVSPSISLSAKAATYCSSTGAKDAFAANVVRNHDATPSVERSAIFEIVQLHRPKPNEEHQVVILLGLAQGEIELMNGRSVGTYQVRVGSAAPATAMAS